MGERKKEKKKLPIDAFARVTAVFSQKKEEETRLGVNRKEQRKKSFSFLFSAFPEPGRLAG